MLNTHLLILIIIKNKIKNIIILLSRYILKKMDVTIYIDDIVLEREFKKDLSKKDNGALAKVVVCEIGLFNGQFGD